MHDEFVHAVLSLLDRVRICLLEVYQVVLWREQWYEATRVLYLQYLLKPKEVTVSSLDLDLLFWPLDGPGQVLETPMSLLPKVALHAPLRHLPTLDRQYLRLALFEWSVEKLHYLRIKIILHLF